MPKDKARAADGVESSDLRGGLTHRTTNDAYRKPKTKLPAQPKSKHGLTFTTSQKDIGDADPMSQQILDTSAGTSIFDPVLCELAYRWFCPPKGMVLDPFAGGSVRGIVAAKLGRKYYGVDLRHEQVRANVEQAKAILGKSEAGWPKWMTGDSADLENVLTEKLNGKPEFDFIFSCPPYADLERYSDDPRDLSTMDYGDFLKSYDRIIFQACERLKDNRFACFVVGDVRDENGNYRGFHCDTIRLFQQAGLELYNHAILVTSVGSLAMRVKRQFETSRKLGKTHQDVLVFVKGDARKATAAIGDVDFGDIEGVDDAKPDQFGELL